MEDAVDGYITLAQAMMDNPTVKGQAFNFSYGNPLDVQQMVDRILGHMGRPDLSPVVLGTAEHEILHQYLSPSKANTNLDWQPKFNLDEGLKKTILWYKNWLEEEVHND